MLRHNKQLVWQHGSSKHLKDSMANVYGNIGDMIEINYSDSKEERYVCFKLKTFNIEMIYFPVGLKFYYIKYLDFISYDI